jgi:diacylglycerol kinase (ATP)
VNAPLVVWINESAGSGLGRRWGERTLTAFTSLGIAVEPVIADDPIVAAEAAARLLHDGASGLVCIGGDGTVHYGLQLVAGTGIPFGIVPAGSGDDIARASGFVQRDPSRCLAQIAGGLARSVGALPTMDLGRATSPDPTVTPRWFGATLYAGFDARVNARANAMKQPRGRARYPVAMLAELATFAPSPFLISLDDGPAWRQEACVAVVANGSSYGGGMQVVPHADAHDGVLDLMLLEGVSRMTLLKVFPRIYSGTHGLHPAVRFHAGRRITLDAPGLEAYADGERVGPLPLSIDVVPGALTLMRPAAHDDAP